MISDDHGLIELIGELDQAHPDIHNLETAAGSLGFSRAAMAAARPEISLEIATQPPLPHIRTRQVRCFLRPPTVADPAAAPLIVVVQGLGGSALDISQKRSRLRMAQAHGAWVCAVDHFGVLSTHNDLSYVQHSVQRLHARLGQRLQRPLGDEFADIAPGCYQCPQDIYWVCQNPEAERRLGGVSDDAWDWGGLQAVDLLNAVRGVRKRISDMCGRPYSGNVHGIGQSAGVQILLSATRFAPGMFASLLDLGGMFFTGLERDLDIAKCLLTNQVGHIGSDNYCTTVVRGPGTTSFVVFRRSPTADPGERLRWSNSNIEQRVALRTMSHGWSAESLAGLRVRSVVGIHDNRPGRESRSELSRALASAGVGIDRRSITEADIDGVGYLSVDHTAIGDLAAVAAKHADLFTAVRACDHRLVPLEVAGARWRLVDVGHLELRHELC